MKYDDFPILDDTSYQIMQREYVSKISQDRHTMLAKIYNHIIHTEHSEIDKLGSLSAKTIEIIKKIKNYLEKTTQNICFLYNFEKNENKIIKKYNLLEFINNLIKLINLFQEYKNLEKTAYYKQYFDNNISELLNLISEIISSFENKYFLLFKYI